MNILSILVPDHGEVGVQDRDVEEEVGGGGGEGEQGEQEFLLAERGDAGGGVARDATPNTKTWQRSVSGRQKLCWPMRSQDFEGASETDQ